MIPESESDGSYNWLFSHSGEWHMAIWGIVIGFILGGSKTLRREVSKESQYVIGCALITFIMRYAYEQRNG
jgi:hypothetical protein